jgi:hypothetical protein
LRGVATRRPFQNTFLKAGALLVLLLLSGYAARRPVDFPVYYVAARAMLSGNPFYGPASGMWWPYRYPPLFLFLFLPLALLPLHCAAVLWAALKFAALYLLTRALFLRLRQEKVSFWFFAMIPTVPYLALEFHYGNAQFLVFALVAAALLALDKHPAWAVLALALGISIKVWPLFFVPYLLAIGRRRVAVWTIAVALGLTLAPAAFFGPHKFVQLAEQWGTQEFGVALAAGEPSIIGFPSQSLHSVMMRYFVSLDYSKLSDPHYPKFNVAAANPGVVEWVWALLAVAGYTMLLLFAHREIGGDALAVHGVAFCGLLLLQPFTQTTDMVVLLWPIVVAAAYLRRGGGSPRWARATLYVSLSLMTLQALLPTAAVHRTLEVLGTNFWLTCLLAAGLVGMCRQNPQTARASAAADLAAENSSAFS